MAENGLNTQDLEAQKNEISEYIKKPLKKGDIWYLVDSRWFKQWKKYVGYDDWDTCNADKENTHPGPIDNSALYKEDGSGELNEYLVEEIGYVLLPQECWDRLVSWYTLLPSQDPIARNVVEYGMFSKQCKVEVYLMEVKLCQNNDLEHCINHKFSRSNTIEHVEMEMRKLFNIPENKETRIWNKCNNNTFEHLNKKDVTIEDSSLYPGQVLVLEQQNDDGTWPRQLKRTTRSYGTVSGNSYSYDHNNGGMGSAQPGLCGLSNLGNTCFMNSALQCMSNTPPLTEYFLNSKHWDELNVNNPLGMRGEIAKSYGELIKTIWSGQFSYTLPRCFKMAVGRFAPQFSGTQQQDCQELMAFLLDGLHEDLNRVKNKPYIELKDANGRPDEVVAKEAWENYQKRNNSIIVDTFHGLLKSTLVCPECSKISVTFDPFCYLSLPLPVNKERQIEVFLVTLDSTKRPSQMKVTVPKEGCIKDLCNVLEKLTGISADNLVVTDVYNHRFYKVYQGDDGLNSIMEKDETFVYELASAQNRDSDHIILPIYMREKKFKSGMNNYTISRQSLFGHPLMVSVPRWECTYEMLYNTILKHMSRYVHQPSKDEEWWIDSSPEGVNGEVDMSNGYNKLVDNGDDEGVSDTEESVTEPPSLFVISSVNPHATIEVDDFKNDDLPLNLTNRTYVAVDWHPKAKKKFYDEKEANEYTIHESMKANLSPKVQPIKLSECLKLFMGTEKLGAEDPWYCPHCRKHQQATKKFDLWSLPQVLIIHLKRFSCNRYWRNKIDSLVDFPVSGLDMTHYAIDPNHGPATYDLIAVANHFGGMSGGHYTAYAKNKDTHQWHYFDDSNVSPTSEENIISKAAYVLFYLKKPEAETRKEETVTISQNGQLRNNEEDYNMDIH